MTEAEYFCRLKDAISRSLWVEDRGKSCDVREGVRDTYTVHDMTGRYTGIVVYADYGYHSAPDEAKSYDFTETEDWCSVGIPVVYDSGMTVGWDYLCYSPDEIKRERLVDIRVALQGATWNDRESAIKAFFASDAKPVAGTVYTIYDGTKFIVPDGWK